MNPIKYYVDADGNYLGGWDANPPEGAVEVPFPPEDARQKWDGSDWLPTTPVEVPVSVQQIAAARLTVVDWDVEGIDRSQGFSAAFMADENLLWVFFVDQQPDTHYMVTPNINVTKYEDYIEIDTTNLSDVRFVVQRVL